MSYKNLLKHKDEIIKPVKGYESFYLISNYGRVFSINYRRTGKTKELSYSYVRDKRRSSKTHYVRAKMWHIKKYQGIKIHTLVALNFVHNPKPRTYNQVNHINGDKGDNRAINLEWADNSKNQIHAFQNGLQSDRKGECHNMSIINDDIALKIMEMLKTFKPIEVSRMLNVSKHIVHDINRRKTWNHLR